MTQYLFKLCPPRAGRPSVTNKNTNIRSYNRRAQFDLHQTFHADRGRRESHFSIQRIVFPTGAKMLIFGH